MHPVVVVTGDSTTARLNNKTARTRTCKKYGSSGLSFFYALPEQSRVDPAKHRPTCLAPLKVHGTSFLLVGILTMAQEVLKALKQLALLPPTFAPISG